MSNKKLHITDNGTTFYCGVKTAASKLGYAKDQTFPEQMHMHSQVQGRFCQKCLDKLKTAHPNIHANLKW